MSDPGQPPDEGSGAARPEAMLSTARTVMERRKQTISEAEQKLFMNLPSISNRYEHPRKE